MDVELSEIMERLRMGIREGAHPSQVEGILEMLRQLTEGCEIPPLERIRGITSRIPTSTTETIRKLRDRELV